MGYRPFDTPLGIMADFTLLALTIFFQYSSFKKEPVLWCVVSWCCEMDYGMSYPGIQIHVDRGTACQWRMTSGKIINS